MRYECKTQAQLDKALAKAGPGDLVVCIGSGRFEAWESSHVEAWESSHVEAWESSHVVARGSSHVEAWGSSHVEAWGSSHVEAWGSSHVEAWGSSHVVAWESSHVVARGSSHVVATPYVSVTRLAKSADIRGGIVLEPPDLTDTKTWLDYHGLRASRGKVVLFKAVGLDLTSEHIGTAYEIGSVVTAPDFNDRPVCGGGLHLGPTPGHALSYRSDRQNVRYLACEVKVADIVTILDGLLSDKCKVPSAKVLYEVDGDGERLA